MKKFVLLLLRVGYGTCQTNASDNEDNILVLQRSFHGALNLRSYTTKW